MKYKVIVSDYDGTISMWNHKVLDSTVEAIKEFMDAGGKFIISSGRMITSIKKQLPKLGLDKISIPLMSFQGSLICDSLTLEHSYSNQMNHNTVKKIVEYAEKNDIYCQYYTYDKVFVKEKNEISLNYGKYTDVVECITPVGDLIEFLDKNSTLAICKVLFVVEPSQANEICKNINIFLNGEAEFTRSASTLLESVDINSGKGNCIKHYAKENGIDISEIVAIGDSQNDYTMIETAGMGIVMGDAEDSLKAVANYVTDKIEDDGFANAVRKIIRDEL